MATANMGITLPTEGGSSGTWDTLLNDAIEDVIDPHDHTSGKGVLIPAAGLNINGDVNWGTNGITKMGILGYAEVASSSIARSGFWKSSDHEYYLRNASGVDIQITSGSSINVSLVGGIGGDYSTSDAALNYDDTTKTYKLMRDTSPSDHYAEVACSDLKLYEGTSGITKYVEIKSPASLANTYTITELAALPASTSLLAISSAGVKTATRDPSVDTVTTTGDAAIGGDCDVTTNATVGGTLDVTGITTIGAFKHGERTMRLNATAGWRDANWSGTTTLTATGLANIFFALPLTVGDRLKSVTLNYERNAVNVSWQIVSQWNASQTGIVALVTDSTSSGWQSTVEDGANLPYTVSTDSVWVHFYTAAANPEFQGIAYVWDRP
jgi:hypothetical protein